MVWKKLGSGNFSSCPNGSRQWIWDVFGECAQDGWDEASVGLGLISILCFAASTFPQYIKACKTGNMDQAVSLWFLLGWIGGDSCNLIGSFLADQLPLQTYTAVYYVLADVVMLSLYFHYKFKKRPSPWSAHINSMLLFIVGMTCVTPLLSSSGAGAAPREVFRGRTLLSVEPGSKPFTRQEIIGFVIGSVSSVLYLFSRLPQIRTNVSRGLGRGVGPWQSGAEGSGPGRGWSGCRAHVGRSSHGVPSAQSRPVAAGQTDTWEVTVQRDKSPRRSLIPPPSPPVPAEIHPGDLLLAVRLGDAGEHAVRAERAAQKPRGGPERGQLPAAPPALARGQPGRPAARHHHLHTVPDIQGRCHLLRAPAAPPQLTRTRAKPRMTGTSGCHIQEGRSMGSDRAADPGLGLEGSWVGPDLPTATPTPPKPL
uniref:Solute carrier family 66 member 1 n=1 Tax=Sus scrofa TaxID=9823 RepID=A0A8D1YXV9_PIG